MRTTVGTKRTRMLACLSVWLLAGCVTAPTPYQAAAGRHGYASEAVSENVVRVRFRGNTATSEEAVRQSLLRRMVEIAEERDAGGFVVLENETECVTALRTSPTTTCVYRQSANEMFPYHFGQHEIDSIWHAGPQREYEASATIQLLHEDICGATPACLVTSQARATLDDQWSATDR